MCRLDMPDGGVNFIIVDNASTDSTPEVVEEFRDRLSIECFLETRPGKNIALNTGLSKGGLGDLIVFTDDDVDPVESWLLDIVSSSARYLDVDVFGGPIRIVWPDMALPGWAVSGRHSTWAFAEVDHGAEERLWPDGSYPFGPNYWIRRSVLESGIRFDEKLGPTPKNRIMGDETKFLIELRKMGRKTMYVPTAWVGHCIDGAAINEAWVLRRAFTMGRTIATLYMSDHVDGYFRSPLVWVLKRRCKWLAAHGRRLLIPLFYHGTSRVDRLIDSWWQVGWNQEALSMAASGDLDRRFSLEANAKSVDRRAG